MFLTIVGISIIIGLLFIIAGVSLAVYIYNGIRKNEDSQKKSLRVLVPSSVVLLLLIGLNTFLIVDYLYENKGKILEKAADGISSGLASTLQNFEKNWDKKRLSQLENLTISLVSIEQETGEQESEDDTKKYALGMIFDNKSPTDVKLYFVDLLGNNYLVACDKDDFSYGLRLKDRYDDNILFGKSKYYFTVEVPKEVEIDHVKYVNKNIFIGD